MTLLLALVLAPFTLLTFGFAVELFAGLRPLRPASVAVGAGASAVIIVPAHNEAGIIAARLAALKTAAEGQANILVVADNCDDSTAAIARAIGAEIIERSNPNQRGKGFALDFARSHLEQAPPAVVIIIDADCSTDAPSLRALIDQCALSGRPIQAVNLQTPARAAPPTVQLSTFAFFIKNVIRQRAVQRLTGHVHLLGTGMAIPWPIFAQAELATDNIVEDLKLGVDLASAGHGPRFIEQATVWSDPETKANTLSQRRRWEGGFLQNAVRRGPRLLAGGIVRASPRAIWAALNVMIPPFALLLASDLFALLAGAFALWLLKLPWWPVLPLAGSIGLAAMGLFLAWMSGGSRFVSLRSLAQAPLYILWKLPLYVGLARRGAPTEWLRTRGGEH